MDRTQNRGGGGPVGGTQTGRHRCIHKIWLVIMKNPVTQGMLHADGTKDGDKLYTDGVNKRLVHLQDGKTFWKWPCWWERGRD